MNNTIQSAGFFDCGLPFNRLGRGRRILLVMQGLVFENQPLKGMASLQNRSLFSFLEKEYTIHVVARKPGLPYGTTIQQMADDYAELIRSEFTPPVDVLGLSTGGSIALTFAAAYPELVRRLVIHSSAHRLSAAGRQLQWEMGQLARQGNWQQVFRLILASVLPDRWYARLLIPFGAWLMGSSAPKSPQDFVVAIEAEDAHDCQDRLGDIRAPTLVIAGENDPYYDRFAATAAGIPHARLILYPGMGHPASGRSFQREVLAFLNEP